MENYQWQTLLKLGNDCFHEKQFNGAESFYWQAYEMLSLACQNEQLTLELLMAWICACHNLAALYEEFGNLELSLKFLMVPHEYLLAVSESNALDDNTQLMAVKGMNITLSAILLFSNKYTICEDCQSQFSSLSNIMTKKASLVH